MTRILVDSSSDYGMKEIKEKNLEFVPIHITIGEKDYIDGVDFEKDEFYEILHSGSEFPKRHSWRSSRTQRQRATP